ncbi:DUF4190 domain-containing protein [Streptomyces tsukubensis]|uniref:DUF4190 domain-containing protein n=1 Tax=Streptomyces tsukubensis TaxID=83656 RepID=A0A1V4A6D5_9ACTN|nr:DUF4190 domain-containing protein [Streptomyces tsukubensis]OON77318.1 hypothetical protein B1H18_18925 [Streptomyces tsukubensis]QFR92394.1 DUF4190 domain-containing protein [Streptomyces tsukubensis]
MTGYGQSGARSRSGASGLAIASLVCGIVGLFFLSIVLGPLAIIFGGVTLRQRRGGGAGMAKAGLVLGVVDVVLFVVLLVAASSGGFSWYVGG